MNFYRWLIFLVISFLHIECKDKNGLTIAVPDSEVSDSVFVSIYHERTGNVIFTDTGINKTLFINIKKLPSDIYTLKIGWPKRLIPPNELRKYNRSSYKNEVPIVAFQKFFYLDSLNRELYFKFNKSVSIDDLEENNESYYLTVSSNSSATNLYEKFEDDFLGLQIKFQMDKDSIMQKIGEYNDKNESLSAREATYLLNHTMQQKYFNEAQFLKHNFIKGNPSAIASAYLLRGMIFDKNSYQKNISLVNVLKGSALSSGYYEEISIWK